MHRTRRICLCRGGQSIGRGLPAHAGRLQHVCRLLHLQWVASCRMLHADKRSFCHRLQRVQICVYGGTPSTWRSTRVGPAADGPRLTGHGSGWAGVRTGQDDAGTARLCRPGDNSGRLLASQRAGSIRLAGDDRGGFKVSIARAYYTHTHTHVPSVGTANAGTCQAGPSAFVV